MANNENDGMLARIEAVIERSWNHLTPGTPDHAYVQQVKKELREAIKPPAPPALQPPAKPRGDSYSSGGTSE